VITKSVEQTSEDHFVIVTSMVNFQTKLNKMKTNRQLISKLQFLNNFKQGENRSIQFRIFKTFIQFENLRKLTSGTDLLQECVEDWLGTGRD